jgi:DNA-binding MarR family transcriptional regulator
MIPELVDIEAVAAMIGHAVTRLMRLQRGVAHGDIEEISHGEGSALYTLDRYGPMTPTELALQERIRKPTVTRILATLEKQGLAARVPHPTDGRQVLVAVSRLGREVLKRRYREVNDWYLDRFADLTAEEIDIMRKAAVILDRIASN